MVFKGTETMSNFIVYILEQTIINLKSSGCLNDEL